MGHGHDVVPPQPVIFYQVGPEIRPAFHAEHDSMRAGQNAPAIARLTVRKISFDLQMFDLPPKLRPAGPSSARRTYPKLAASSLSNVARPICELGHTPEALTAVKLTKSRGDAKRPGGYSYR